jgi:hypothetical protein
MNDQIMENMTNTIQAMRTINALGIRVIGIQATDNRSPRIHLHGEFDPDVFGRQVTTDYEREDKYIEHSVMLNGATVFWLTEK